MSSARSLLVALLLFAAGFLWLGSAERTLWRNAPGDALDRYALGTVLPPGLPDVPLQDELWTLCRKPWHSYAWAGSTALAWCLEKYPDYEIGDETIQRWTKELDAQVAYLRSITAVAPKDMSAAIQHFRQVRTSLAAASGCPHIATLNSPDKGCAPIGVSIPSAQLSTQLAEVFRTPLERIESRRKSLAHAWSIAGQPADRWQVLRELALEATGLKWDIDNALPEPTPRLITNRDSTAYHLAWLRSASRLSPLVEPTLSGWLSMLTASAFTAVAFAGVFRAAPVAVAALFVIAGVGAIHQIDIAVTGPTAVKYLPMHGYGIGPAGGLGFAYGLMWGPTMIFLFALVSARLATIKLWCCCDRVLRSPIPYLSLAIVVAIALLVLAPISSALRTELLMLCASVAAAMFVARYAPLLATGASSWRISRYVLPLVGVGIAASLLVGLARVDPLGGIGISLLSTLILATLLLHGNLSRLAMFALVAVVVIGYAHFLAKGSDAIGLLDLLPLHGKSRFMAAHDSLSYGAPDVSLVKWLAASSALPGTMPGWGFGNVPWAGLPGLGPSNRAVMPVSAVSDLSVAMLIGVGGLSYALTVVAVLIAVLLFVVRRGLIGTFASNATLTQRFLNATGSIGLTSVVLRIVVNVAGALQVLPFAGLPAAFISHAPSATAMALAYVGLVLGAHIERKD